MALANGSAPFYFFCSAIFVFIFLVYGFYLRGNLPVGADNTLFYAPFYALRWEGGPPLWNPYSLSGTSLANNLQAALLYPLRWPFYFIADWRGYFGLFVFIHYLIAGWGMAGLLRSLRASRLAALGGAIVFAAGGHMAGRIINPTIFQASCWLPWLLWGAAGPGWRHAALTALGAAMIFTIGSPHLIFYGTLAWGMFFVIIRGQGPGARGEEKFNEGDTQHKNRLAPSPRPLAPILSLAPHLAAWALAFLFAAPTLVPGVLRAQSSIRTHSTVEANLADSAEYAELGPILAGGTGAAIHPEYIDKCCYVGPVVLALAAWLMLRIKSWRDRRFLGGLALVGAGLFFALGRNAGLQYILPHLPIIKNLAGASRALVLTAAGLAILTALALDELRSSRRWILACLMFVAAVVAYIWFFVDLARAAAGQDLFGVAAQLARAWALAPSAVERPFFGLIEAAAGLLAAGVILLAAYRAPAWGAGALIVLILAMLWHFEPRVHPPTKRREFFEPPPPVAFLQAERDRATQAPFRVAGYDPLRLHDTEFDNPFKFHFLMPNMATLFRLEDINGFDPLILVNYLDLFLATSGRAPHNDPIRNLDIARPDLKLFDLLGVRFLAGHPYDRRLTTIPLTLTPEQPAAPVAEWKPERAEGAVTHWLFVGLLDRALNVPLDEEVARLHVEAEEGTFDFPIKNGREVADVNALNFPPLLRKIRATLISDWATNALAPEMDYRLRRATWRGAVPFGRPLRVRRVEWRLVNPRIVFNIAGQAYRISAPPPDWDPWVLRFGTADDVAPVYEYRNAKPRALLVNAAGLAGGSEIKIGDEALNAPSPDGAVEWIGRGNGIIRLRVRAERAGLLVLREIWDAGWQAEVNGAKAEILRVNGLLRAVRVSAGQSEITMSYRPWAAWGI